MIASRASENIGAFIASAPNRCDETRAENSN